MANIDERLLARPSGGLAGSEADKKGKRKWLREN